MRRMKVDVVRAPGARRCGTRTPDSARPRRIASLWAPTRAVAAPWRPAIGSRSGRRRRCLELCEARPTRSSAREPVGVVLDVQRPPRPAGDVEDAQRTLRGEAPRSKRVGAATRRSGAGPSSGSPNSTRDGAHSPARRKLIGPWAPSARPPPSIAARGAARPLAALTGATGRLSSSTSRFAGYVQQRGRAAARSASKRDPVAHAQAARGAIGPRGVTCANRGESRRGSGPFRPDDHRHVAGEHDRARRCRRCRGCFDGCRPRPRRRRARAQTGRGPTSRIPVRFECGSTVQVAVEQLRQASGSEEVGRSVRAEHHAQRDGRWANSGIATSDSSASAAAALRGRRDPRACRARRSGCPPSPA